jgi:hypothetical protein
MVTEGRVFVCSWRRVGGRFRVWVKRRPRLAATGRTFGEADEALWGVIAEATGDGENQREYDRARPDEQESGPLLGLLSRAFGRGRMEVANPDELFENEVCPQCGKVVRHRTSVSIVANSVESGYQAGKAHAVLGRSDLGYFSQYFSRDFIGLLTRRERSSFEWRPVQRRRGTKRYVELLGAEVTVPRAALKGAGIKIDTCAKCGGSGAPTYVLLDKRPKWLRMLDRAPTEFVDVADLPQPVPSCFAIGNRGSSSLAFTPERWRSLLGRKESQGIGASTVGIVASEYVERIARRRAPRARARRKR